MKIHRSYTRLAVYLSLLTGLFFSHNSFAQELPEWMSVDNDAKTVTLEIVAGKTDALNNWNFNGYVQGNATITVPEGYSVNLTFTNNDPNMVHSIGVTELMEAYPAMFDNPTPVFEGAISSNATDMTNATATGKSEELTFKASKAGNYALVCLIPAHAITGMWIKFNVSADGSAGFSAS